MAQVTINKRAVGRVQQKLKDLIRPSNRRTAKEVGNAVVRAIRDETERLNSPIQGRGKFPALKEPYRSRKGRAGKGKKPNLRFSGDFMRSLTTKQRKVRGGWNAVIGYFNKLSRLKERGHREGANGQRLRPTIPTRGESFNQRITKIILDIYQKRVRQIVRRK